MTAVIGFLNTVFWGYVLIYGLLAVGLYFTVRLKLIQIVHFAEMFRAVRGSGKADRQGISPFQALTISLASRVGTGNIAGVAVAISLGGPGAIFWMWMVATVGMATAYAESTLAQLYKIRGPGGLYRGGPAFYIARGLGMPWLGAVFSVCLILSFGLVFNAVQANAISDSFEKAFGAPRVATGIVIAAFTAIVIFGGIRKIAKVAELVVPFMAGAYLLMAIYILITHAADVPAALSSIVLGAFGYDQAAGGVAGGVTAAMMNGVRRGLFSNEAGMGSAPNIAAVATPDPHHPSTQGFVQALGVFIDTILICTATAVIILLSGVMYTQTGIGGAQLTQGALDALIGPAGKWFIAVALFFFAFTSVIGNYSYSENALTFLGVKDEKWFVPLRLGVLGMVIWGSLQSVATVFDTADASMGLMATVNLIAILLLSGTVAKLTKDYFDQKRAGELPVFHAEDYPELAGKIDLGIWRR